MADLPIAPGQPYIEVEYDYEYKSKDRLITIRQGECYLLVKKTNEDWWQVRKEGGSKPFYVPAQYVREVRKALMPPAKPVHGHAPAPSAHPPAPSTHPPAPSAPSTHPPAALWVKPSNLELPERSETLNRRESNSRRSSSQSGPGQWSDSSPLHSPLRSEADKALPEVLVPGGGGVPRHSSNSSTLPRSRARSPELSRAPLDVDTHQCDSAGEDRRTNESESGDELSSSSTEQLQTVSSSGHGRSESPVYSNLQELKISGSSLPPLPSAAPVATSGDWETHRDPSGRLFYYNHSTQERTWKPPRVRDHGGGPGQGRGEAPREGDNTETSLSLSLFPLLSLSVSEDHSAPSSLSDSQCGSPPRGWSEEMDEFGHTLYICDFTNEKWLKHVDDQGRQYYYNADGSRSEWELPKYNHSPLHLTTEGAKTRSLDRKHVEPIVPKKWRHSTHILEPCEKRLLKARRLRSGSARLQPYASHRHDPAAGLRVPGPDSENPPSSPKPPSSPSEKCGVLNMTKITENGKKVRKNWTSSWTVLQGSSLLFTKGQGGGSSSWFGGGQSKPELTVDLKGASVDWASKDRSSKKHVLELKTRQGTELLIQSDNEAMVQEWFRAIQDSISAHAWESDEAIEEDMPESPGREEKCDREKEHRDSKKERGIKNSNSMDVSENKKTKHKLKKFLTRRPTLQAVRDKGYIKDQVFGCSLASLCLRESSTVPRFVKMCIEHVESNGLSVDGLYRVSGNLAVIQKLRFAVNHDEKVNLSDSKWEDIHVTTGALKMFFRELPEPLFTYALFHDFVNAIKSPDYRQRVQSIKDLVRQLPKPNHDTMQALFKHLHRVVDHGDDNRMTIQSVAIVFGPTLLRPETETWNMAVHMVYQNQIVELILIECENIFGR